MKYNILILLIRSFTLFACDKNDDQPVVSNCNFETIIRTELYISAPDDNVTINGLEINDNCRKITFSASGCSEDT